MINIDKSEVETWLMDAIVEGIIDAHIDEEHEMVEIHSFSQRTVTSEKWEILGKKLQDMKKDFGEVIRLIRPQ